jgi:predicted nuclease of restriction endonuclease-like (RecB) superfamily
MVLLDAVKKPDEREWYMRQTVENGWSRNVLVHQIDGRLYRRQGKAAVSQYQQSSIFTIASPM